MSTNSNMNNKPSSSISFSDFPEDVQLCILSFLTPQEISLFSCTSKKFISFKNDPKLWFAMCHRKWGSKISKWSKISYKLLYKTLQEFDNLIGFWRLSCNNLSNDLVPQLVLFEWGEFCVFGFKIAPSEKGSYKVKKDRFFIGGLDSDGEKFGFVDPDGSFEFSGDFQGFENLSYDLVRVDLNFVGRNHIVVEEYSRCSNSDEGRRGVSRVGRNHIDVEEFSRYSSLDEGRRGISRVGRNHIVVEEFSRTSSLDEGRKGMSRVGSSSSVKEEEGGEEVYGSPGSGGILDIAMLDIYQRYANSTSPGGSGSWRRQRRRERERMGKRKWESEHFVRIENCSPTLAHPLQGLWKGICDDMTLAFYLVAYDDIGGIACRRIGNSSSGHTPVFWALSTTLTESPFSAAEEHIYNSRMHVQPLTESEFSYEELPPSEISDVSRLLNITSNYDLVISDLAVGRSSNSQQVEGRIWQYGNGMFGFGFLWNNYIIDLKHIFHEGIFLDSVGISTS